LDVRRLGQGLQEIGPPVLVELSFTRRLALPGRETDPLLPLADCGHGGRDKAPVRASCAFGGHRMILSAVSGGRQRPNRPIAMFPICATIASRCQAKSAI